MGACLGRGGFGEVYRAVMVSPGGLEREVAVKLLRDEMGLDDDAVHRLIDEARLLARINHPAVPHVYGLVQLEGRGSGSRHALVSEFVDGVDLGKLIGTPHMPSARALMDIIGAVASALHAGLTEWGPGDEPLRLVHRDVKPANIRIDRHGRAVLLDFGIAHAASGDRAARTATGMVVGSLGYLSPERLHRGLVDPAADVFALGICLLEAVVGRPGSPWVLPHSIQGLASVLATRVDLDDHLAEPLGAAPVELRELIRSMTLFEPEHRPTAAQVRDTCMILADRLEGRSLKAWCRATSWPLFEFEGEPGPLEGHTLYEGAGTNGVQLEAVSITRSPVDTVDGLLRPPPSGRTRVILWGSMALAVGLTIVVIAVVMGSIVWGLFPG